MPQMFSKNQAAAVVRAVYEQVTGKHALMGLDSSDIVSMADATLQVGVDPLVTALSQVYSRYIMSYRPYRGQFATLDMGDALYGNGIRKFTALGKSGAEDDNGYKLVQDGSVDMYKINKPKIVQTNFYGSNVWQYHLTIYEKQLRSAFRDLRGVQELLNMTLGELDNDFEQEREGLAKLAVLNLVAATAHSGNEAQHVHLLTEYNALTGGEYTAEQLLSPENIRGFAQWLAGRVEILRQLMATRSTVYHLSNVDNVNGVSGTILRHTPRDRQRMLLRADIAVMTDNLALSNTHHPDLVTSIAGETVGYWQNPADPYKISLTKYRAMKNDGTLSTESVETEYTENNLIGVLYDVDAVGYSIVDEGVSVTPFNSAGRYYNIWYNWDKRYINDQTENVIIMTLD